MTETNTLGLRFDKAKYVEGEIQTLSLVGDFIVTSEVTVDPGEQKTDLGKGDSITSDAPAHPGTLTDNLEAAFEFPTFVDSLGQQWTTEPNGRTAKAKANPKYKGIMKLTIPLSNRKLVPLEAPAPPVEPANVGPTAAAAASVVNDLQVNVSSSASSDGDGTIVSRVWDWGDGSANGSGVTASHTYASPGVKTITLTVADDDGAVDTDTVQITVTANVGPTAVISTPSVAQLAVTVNGSGSTDGDGSIVAYNWNWGDGQTSTGVSPGAHTYASAGTKTITLTVTDNDGATGVASRTAVAVAPPPEWVGDFAGDVPPGKVLWGAAVGGNGDPIVRHETPAGHVMGCRRTFWSWNQAATTMITTAKADVAKGRTPCVSFKPPTNSTWAAVGAGTHDAALRTIFRGLGTVNGPVLCCFNHEPENDQSDGAAHAGTGPNGGAADWLNAQSRIRQIITELGAECDNVSFGPILMSWTFVTASGRNPNHWYRADIWDWIGIDHYQGSEGATGVTDSSMWGPTIAKILSWNLPMLIGEWGNRGSNVQAANEMQAWFNYCLASAAAPTVPRIFAVMAFDSGLNSPDGSWELLNATDGPLKKFRDLMNDPNAVLFTEV